MDYQGHAVLHGPCQRLQRDVSVPVLLLEHHQPRPGMRDSIRLIAAAHQLFDPGDVWTQLLPCRAQFMAGTAPPALQELGPYTFTVRAVVSGLTAV